MINLLQRAAAGSLNSSHFALQRAAAELRAGDASEAERILREHIQFHPMDAAACAKLAEIIAEQGQFIEALLLLRRTVGIEPEFGDARLHIARILDRQGEPQLAIAEIDRLPLEAAGRLDIRAFRAALLGKLNRHGEEIALYEQLVSHRPADEGMWMSFGNTLKTVGRTDEAVAALQKSVTIRPAFGEAWWSLANLKTVRFTDRDLAKMRKALRGRVSRDDALHLHFALGKALEERGRVEEAFHQYRQGNELRVNSFGPQQLLVSEFIDASIAAFDEDIFSRSTGAGHPANDPIFVVGLQRSGSTLIEQILASHPRIEGTSELTIIPQLWMRLESAGNPFDQLAKMDPCALAALGQEYLDRARPYRQSDKPRFIDKLPANWIYAPFIRMILPNAKIIDARRHPMACGFSNFRQLYATGVAFSYSLQSIGRFYADYVRQMAHLNKVQPGATHRVINERLIDHSESEVRRMLDFVGEPFDPACLEFYNNKRAVRSPSAEQVRRPLNRDGVDSWRPFEPWLKPLENELGDILESWDRN